ncbi:MAG: basic amino acid ABC transporter substrate-binding protein [Planctomycetota bacterium]|jgi:polar amino acid transport system substrate-binding protein
MLRRTFIAGVLAGAAAALMGCNGKSDGTVRVATEAAYRPFEFVEKGEITGFDVELIRAVAKAGGFTVEISNQPWDGMFPGLQAKRYDLVISAVSITEDRKKTMAFSDPYLESGLIIAVKKDNDAITTLEHLKGKTIAVQLGTTGHDKAKTVEGATIVKFDSVELALAELDAGRADAVINDQPVTAFYIKSMTNLKMVGEKLSAEHYGMAMRKDDTALVAKVNAGLKAIRDSGEYDALVKKWLSAE